jgi:uncharacterized protein YqiB (DUF1249 family)
MLLHAIESESDVSESDVDEGEAMLQRAIAMVRSATTPSNAQARRSSPSRIVRIYHDARFDAAYAAQDTTSGLVVLRHQDSARLRAMCQRLGWQVTDQQPVERATPGAGA